MPNRPIIEYPALVYEENGIFTADCVLFNLATFGKSEIEAVTKLQSSMSKALEEFKILIKPIYEKRTANI